MHSARRQSFPRKNRIQAFAAILSVLVVSGAAFSADETENLERYIGLDLTREGRAARAKVDPLLPLACPPFYLRDGYGQIIDANVEPDVSRPVSTKQTCGECHDYARITQGYHFQAGKDELYPENKPGEPAPLSKGPGCYGKWLPFYQRELAPKRFDHPNDVDMTSYQWVAECGVCHPGGGPAEYDRGFRRYDEAMGSDPGLAATLDGDYYQARWNESGVVEADCFICHLDGYDYSIRAQQLKKLNFRWAATAAAGFGAVEGAVKENEVPRLAYRKEWFGPDGKVKLAIRRPSDRACQFCHEISGIEKRGTGWHSHYMPDVHSDRGIQCTDCHPGDIRHHFAKGRSLNLTVRDDLDGTAPTCRECHDARRMGATPCEHRGIPPLHFDKLSCEACHITKRPFLSARTIDTLSGKAIALPNTMDAFGPESFAFGAWWGKAAAQQPGAELIPFSPDEIALAAAQSMDADPVFRIFEQENGAASEEARGAMLKALAKTPGLVKPFIPVCVFRGTAYAMNGDRLDELPVKLDPKRVGSLAEYPVVCVKTGETRPIEPVGYQIACYWLAFENDVVRPLRLSEMKAAFDFLADAAPMRVEDGKRQPLAVYDDNNDRWPEANTDAEIGLVGWAVARTQTRFKNPALVYVKGTNAYRVAIEQGRRLDKKPAAGAYLILQDGEDASYFETPFTAAIERSRDIAVRPFRERLYWNIAHGVEPVADALGAKGCAECHSEDAHFFRGRLLSDGFTQDGGVLDSSAHRGMHIPSLAVTFGAWREEFIKPASPWIVLGALGFLLLHFVLFGTHQRAGGYGGPEILRFRAHERIAHFIAMTSIVFLAVTGFCFLLGRHDPLGPWARPVHTWLGYAGAAGAAFILLSWMWFMLPGRGDWRWLCAAGGYFGGGNSLPAGKFNAGQKLLFWFSLFLMAVLSFSGVLMAHPSLQADDAQSIIYTMHDLAALFMILAIMAHLYLAAAVNPHSLRSLFGGRVSLAWAQEHHSLWKSALHKDGPGSPG